MKTDTRDLRFGSHGSLLMWNNFEIHSMRIQPRLGDQLWNNYMEQRGTNSYQRKRNGCDGGIDLVDKYTKYRVRKSLLHADQELSRVINSL